VGETSNAAGLVWSPTGMPQPPAGKAAHHPSPPPDRAKFHELGKRLGQSVWRSQFDHLTEDAGFWRRMVVSR